MVVKRISDEEKAGADPEEETHAAKALLVDLRKADHASSDHANEDNDVQSVDQISEPNNDVEDRLKRVKLVANLTALDALDYYTLSLEQIDLLYGINKELIAQRLEARKEKINEVCQSIHNKRYNRPYLFYLR